MIQIHEPAPLYEHIIHYDEEKQVQVRVTVNTFKGFSFPLTDISSTRLNLCLLKITVYYR